MFCSSSIIIIIILDYIIIIIIIIIMFFYVVDLGIMYYYNFAFYVKRCGRYSSISIVVKTVHKVC